MGPGPAQRWAPQRVPAQHLQEQRPHAEPPQEELRVPWGPHGLGRLSRRCTGPTSQAGGTGNSFPILVVLASAESEDAVKRSRAPPQDGVRIISVGMQGASEKTSEGHGQLFHYSLRTVRDSQHVLPKHDADSQGCELSTRTGQSMTPLWKVGQGTCVGMVMRKYFQKISMRKGCRLCEHLFPQS